MVEALTTDSHEAVRYELSQRKNRPPTYQEAGSDEKWDYIIYDRDLDNIVESMARSKSFSMMHDAEGSTLIRYEIEAHLKPEHGVDALKNTW